MLKLNQILLQFLKQFLNSIYVFFFKTCVRRCPRRPPSVPPCYDTQNETYPPSGHNYHGLLIKRAFHKLYILGLKIHVTYHYSWKTPGILKYSSRPLENFWNKNNFPVLLQHFWKFVELFHQFYKETKTYRSVPIITVCFAFYVNLISVGATVAEKGNYG